MKTQISREGFRADKRYSGVYQQQGRLITDRDWNELVEIFKARLDDALADVVGSGSPKQKAAAISMVGGAPRIAAGVVYAGGVEARVVAAPGVSASPFGLHEQADFPSPPPLPAAGTAYRLYADLWERPVVSLEDLELRDAGLHGADTCTRTQTMAQVKWCPTTKDPESAADNPGRGSALLTVAFPQDGGPAGSDPCDPQTQQVDPVGGDFLFRLEVHDARWPAGAAPNAPDRVVVKWSRENGAEQFLYEDMPDWFTTGLWRYELFDLDAEKHLGFHLATSPGWTPKRGSLTETLPPSPPAGTSARRWDGYCVLVRTGNTWNVSNAAGETPTDTAPGAQIQVSNGKLTVGLGDLEVTLELTGKVLLPGDYWSTAVRRAVFQAGTELLKNALPMGIQHRYVTLAEVQTSNQLKPRTAVEQRKLAFPRLSELDAGDMGYSTTCTSGLFDAGHDTVKKALDRLCSINGTHVGYSKPSDTSVFRGHSPSTVAQALNLLADVQSDDIGYVTTCSSGLYDGTHDTVKKALDRLCAINATHVGFTKPADTSIFQGASPATVAQALGLLANVQSQQISYFPAQNPAVNDVKEALDELYARPVNNGSRVYIGPAGQYASVDLAVSDLLSQGRKNIALALLPGDHTIPNNWNPGDLAGVHLSILGLDGAARLSTKGIFLARAASFHLHQACLIVEDNNSVTFSSCGDVVLTDNVLESDNLVDKALFNLEGVRRVLIRDNVIDSQWESVDPFVANILGLNAFEDIQDLFSVGLTEFRSRALALSQTLANLPPQTRSNLGSGLINRLTQNQNQLNPDEFAAYQVFGRHFESGIIFGVVEAFARSLEHLRHVLYVKNPGTSLLINDNGPTLIKGNQIHGLIGLLSLPKSNVNLSGNPSGFLTNVQGGKVHYLFARNVLQVTGNVMAGIRGGEDLTGSLINVANGNVLHYGGAFRVVAFTDNVIENEDNLFIGEEVNLQGNIFAASTTPILQILPNTVAWVVASSAVYLNNRARVSPQGSQIYNGVAPAATLLLAANNFRLAITSA